MMGLGVFELVVVLVLVVLIFGAGRIGRIGTELGSAIRGFRESVKSEDHTKERARVMCSVAPKGCSTVSCRLARQDLGFSAQAERHGAECVGVLL